MRQRILLVAEEIVLRARIGRALVSSGFAVELASDEKRALKLARENNFGMAIVAPGSYPANLAMMLELRDTVPQMIALAERLEEIARLHRSLPGSAILLKSDESALITRVSEMTTATTGEPAPVPSILCMEDCRLDLAGHVFVTAGGREVSLTRAESEILKELARHPCRVLSRDKLRHVAAGRDVDPFDRSIDMLVARLRRKIEPDPKVPRFLVTVPGVGYKLMARPLGVDARQSKPQSTGPERRQITALCCKLVGAVELAVEFDPEDASRITGNFHDEAISAITQMGGTIATVTPDQILALFGYPEAHEDDAERAVSAGVDALAKISQLPSPTGEPLQMRIGVTTGLALASQMQAVGGPSVVAVGVCDLAAPNSILITASTRALLSNTFICDNPERYALAGLSEAVSACRVTGKRTVASRFKARHSNKLTHLVGRDRELDQLATLWDRAKRGEGQVALICGEAGIGKSHLCEFLLGHLIEEPHATFRYQCSPHHTNSPFYPVISQLEHAMGFEQADTPALKFKKLEAGLSVEATKEEILSYASLLSIATPQRESSLGFTPQRQKHLTIAALSRHLGSLAEKQPLIIVLADAHWIDSSTLDLVNSVIPLIKTVRVFFLIEFRPEFMPQWLGEPHVTMLTLDRIGRDQSHAIISEVIGHRTLPREVEEQIIDKTEGIPLFIEELTKSVLESDLAENVGDRHVAPGRLPLLAVPASLLDSLTARLDRLGPAKEIAQIGSVIGREFSQPLLAVVARASTTSLQAALAQLEASELVFANRQSSDVTYRFKHALLQDAAYATLSRVKRQQLHSLVAEALENGFPLTVETQPELLAHHFTQAGLTDRAVDYLLKAGQRSIEHSANVGAIGHLTYALELLRGLPDAPQRKHARFRAEVMLAHAMMAAYGYAAPMRREALLRARALIDNSTDPAQKFALLYGIWAFHYVAGEIAKQRTAAAEFMAEAEQTTDLAMQCIANRIVGTTHLTMGEFATGWNHLKRARELYDPERHAGHRHRYGQDIGAATLCYLSWALWHLGYVDQASEAATEAMNLAEKLSHPHTLVYTICHARGFMDLFRRRNDDMQYARLVISICNDNALLHWVNCGNILDGWAAVCAGQVDQGIKTLREGLVGWQKGGARLWMPTFLMLEAEACAKAGRDAAALQVIERAVAICEDNGERWAMAEVLRTKARLQQSTRRANFLEIESILIDSLEIARRQQARCWELRTSCDLSRLWQRRGQSKKALELLQPVYDQFTEGFDTADLRDAQRLLRDLRQDLRCRASKEGGTKQGLQRRK
jgi:class 3 adenylate cyclase/DNA-binding response OmpR family regulator/predicted ATPase